MQHIRRNPKISSAIFGSKPINNIPKKEVIIKIHFLLLIDSPINTELNIIAKGIDSCAPITMGDKMFDWYTERYKNKFTPVPIEIENPINGNKYLLFGISILQKGIRQTKTKAILIAPNNIGGI